MLSHDVIHKLLEEKYKAYNTSAFIDADPIRIPHLFTQLQDIEIAGFFAAILAWGNRTSILNSCNRLLEIMDDAPYDFIIHHQPHDLKRFIGFVHRTFNATDLLYTIEFLQWHYKHHKSLESAFITSDGTVEQALIYFHNYFFSLPDYPDRTRKHIATPLRHSACKRLNMYLRWMVRKDDCGVDFGLWQTMQPNQLICPLDVHVANVAHRLGLLENIKSNWKNALALTDTLRTFDANDPVKYDYALFGLGVMEKFR